MGWKYEMNAFQCNEIGMTINEDTRFEQMPDGRWKAFKKIGSIFGAEVDGELCGIGATKELALKDLENGRKKLNDSLWY